MNGTSSSAPHVPETIQKKPDTTQPAIGVVLAKIFSRVRSSCGVPPTTSTCASSFPLWQSCLAAKT